MHTPILTLPTQNPHIGLDAAIGQIDMIGGSGEVLRSWRIQSPKCTLGSGPECSVQMDAKVAAPLHATLVFGKKHALLRAFAPIRIANRNVREWLIDHPTEILIGDCRLVVHPSIAVMATPDAIDLSANLASIERLLLSLHEAIERVQESLAVESKQSRESIESAVSTEIDAIGKRWFSSLSGQIQNQSEVQQSLFSDLSEQFTGRFGAIDEQLLRFAETSSQHTNSLNALLEQARDVQSSMEARFQYGLQPAIAAPFEKAGFPPDLEPSFEHVAESRDERAEPSGYVQVVEPNFGRTIEKNAIDEDDLKTVPSALPAWFTNDETQQEENDETQQEEIVTPESKTEAISIEEMDIARTPPPHNENSGTVEEESIEEYMQRLLHRVRGTDNLPAAQPTLPPTKTSIAARTAGPAASRMVPSVGVVSNDVDSTPFVAEPLTNESFVPRQQAPEHRDELDALRELANSNARRALSRSDNRRINSAFFFKLGVTGVAVFSAVAILLLNGLVLNMSFVGMIAAVVVSLLWGYDCLTHFKQLQNESQQIRDSTPRTASMNAIQIGSTDGLEDRWRPSVS
ncbi:MAG: FHA domain-containing protein [Planctomycetota bacterium]|nr:FHA domain-containing protein [Planctomycetota bacterium]